MMTTGIVATLLALGAPLKQTGTLVPREIDRAPEAGDAILREDFERCEPAGAVVRDERRDNTWCLRTKDWPTPLLNAVGNPPDLTYDPQLKGVYDIYVGSRATDFTVSVGMKLSGESDFTIITSPRGTKEYHYDWEYAFRREAPMDGQKIIIHALGAAAYLDYL